MSNKITCAVCQNEENGVCMVKKKIGISLNKRRNCDKFSLHPSKVKEKQIVKTIKLSYTEREMLRKLYKQELKKLKEKKDDSIVVNDSFRINSNEYHPLTGDLSRFKSTANS
ncbi:hypothetical protein COY61_01045 [bacterium (Candidatus Gribaldobacteria) CG_4_10_14_0_8_um_filter_33_9]|uniref:Uncharacterized protein n=1 Tax=bacterium (Candidatus Gribaldobacteria) CG_4_10_14_0_8_um_filter_33_9 TaxID=2014266 RepID=A0A2M7RNE6_9BACT|nr:MAG: hypothetical protein COY61_01045 [bacterium (Candidatus Gribaldobacteria) CG_4_10_14_0_8_um_filter_33_9]